MKAVILAGGLGSRLNPLTKVTNKHLLPIYDKPMIYYPLQTVKDAGFDEVMVVVGGPFAGHFISILKNGEDFGFKDIRYAYQEGEGGIAEALALAEDFADGEKIFVMLGDNILDTNLTEIFEEVEKNDSEDDARIFLKATNTPEKFGVAVFNDFQQVVGIVEKPVEPYPSKMAVIGLYIFPYNVFGKIKSLDYSARGELEVTDLNNLYIKEGKMSVVRLDSTDFWSDCGSFETMNHCSNHMIKIK